MSADRKAPTELELKLELSPQAAKRIRGHQLLKSLDGETGFLEARYFDTGDDELRKDGYSLRVRRNGEKSVQTLKRGAGSAGLFDRSEWESEVAGLEPDAAALETTPLRKKRKLVQRLKPVASSVIERSTWLLNRDHYQIEIALDEGCFRAGRRKVPVVELELELVRGEPCHLFQLARELGTAAPLRLSVLSKGERAYRVARRESGKFEKAPKIRLGPDMNVAQAFSAIASSCFRHFRLNEELIVAQCDAAALHQARVSVRRLRAAMSLFGSAIRDSRFAELREELRWFTSSLGDARDLDVFLKGYGGELSKRDRGKLLAARKEAYRTANAAIDSNRFRLLLLNLLEWSETGDWRSKRKARASVKPFAVRRLDRLWTKWSEGGAQLTSLDEEQRHRFRIRVKKMRYAVEFLGSLFDEQKVRDFTKALEAMQESLGDLNDQSMARQLVADLSLDFTPSDRGEIADRLELAVKSYARLQSAGPFWAAERSWLIRQR